MLLLGFQAGEEKLISQQNCSDKRWSGKLKQPEQTRGRQQERFTGAPMGGWANAGGRTHDPPEQQLAGGAGTGSTVPGAGTMLSSTKGSGHTPKHKEIPSPRHSGEHGSQAFKLKGESSLRSYQLLDAYSQLVTIFLRCVCAGWPLSACKP